MFMKHHRTFLFIMLMLTLVFTLSCSNSGGSSPGLPTPSPALPTTVSGVVKDIGTSMPLPGVTVSNGINSTMTDVAGAYLLGNMNGRFTMSASSPGYLTTFRVLSAANNTTLNWALTPSYGSQDIPAMNMDYVILAWNDLGMHCCQDDYSYFLILPPFNTVHVQVIKRGEGPVTDGITVSYSFPNKTDSTKNTNFWEFSGKYGWKNLPPNVGITGTPLAGDMAVDGNALGFVAQGIPVTPYDDDGQWDPFGAATITVKDNATGSVLQTASVVVPVSTELNCGNCHQAANPQLDILQKHDQHNSTTLVSDRSQGTLHLCSECHADNALGAPGKPGVKSLSLAMHDFHKDKTHLAPDDKMGGCYNCHPGPKTECLRGIMKRAGMLCTDCHGDLTKMASSIEQGRQPWLQEPKCGDCHGDSHKENDNTLFRNSVFNNSWTEEMNGKIYCEACHNSTHAEYVSANAADAVIPQKFQGDNKWVWNCFVCHTDSMTSPSMHK